MVDYKYKEVCGLVSVIIPTYKRSDKLGRAIDSVLEQSYDKVEVIVVDDNTNGDDYRKATSKLMEQYANNPMVHYIQHEKNMNGSAARNTGIVCSQGEYIAFLDDDDYFLNTKIEKSLQFLRSVDESYGGVCTNYVKKNNSYIYKIGTGSGVYNDCYELMTKQVDFAAGSTLLCKRSAISEIGLFDVSFIRHQDWEFLIRFFRKYKLKIIGDIGVVICTDGFRNIPKTDILFQMKEKLFSLFLLDIQKLGEVRCKEVFHAQWIELSECYLKEKSYSKAYRLLNKNIGLAKLKCKDYVGLMFSFVVGLYPSIMKLIYFIYSKKHRIKIDL